MRVGWRIGVSVAVAVAVFAGAALIGLLSGLAQRDSAFTIDAFDRLVVVEADGTTTVGEVIDVTFHESRRGIFRDLPDERRFQAGGYQIITVDQGSADRPWNWIEERGPDGPRIRIGEASTWLQPGQYRYRLIYEAPTWSHVQRRDRDIVETRIDIPGFEWPTDVARARLTLVSPGEVIDAQCVEGQLRSTRPCAQEPVIEGDTVIVELGPYGDHEAATVAVQVPADAFTTALPVHHQPALGTGGIFEPIDVPRPVAAMLLALLIALPLLALDVIYARAVYRDQVTDPQLHDRLHPTALPAPPHGFRPPETAGLLLRRNSQALFLATLVDLDQRGLVTTSATEKGKHHELTVSRPDTMAEPPPPGDLAFIDALVPANSSTRFGDKYDSAVAKRIQKASSKVTARARDVFRTNGYKHDGGLLLRSFGMKALLTIAMIVWIVMATRAVTGMTPLAGAGAGWTVGLVVVGWIIAHLPWRHHRVPLNSQGRDATAQARAFDEFVRTVEAEQLEWASGQPGIDHLHPAVSLLPYAIALGHADSWYDRFGSVMTQLAAAAGAGAAAGGTAWWASQRSYSGVRSAQSATSTAPSSSSGGGGGGSGGGGGGGGSW